MKRILSFILVVSILVQVISAHAQTTVEPKNNVSVQAFESRFSYAAAQLGSNHKISEENITFNPGNPNDMIIIKMNNAFALQISLYHDTLDVCQAWVIFVPGASQNEGDSLQFLYYVSEVLYAFGVIYQLSETEQIMNELNMVEIMEKGESNIISYHEKNIGIWSVTGLSYVFAISEPIE